MKKYFSCVALILLAISCSFFSACGDKYGKLSIEFLYNSLSVEETDLMVSEDKNKNTKTFEIQLKDIEQKDIGQIIVYSIPQELVSVSNYHYSGNSVFVDVKANISGNGKLVAKHLASNKTKQIDLSISQQSTNLSLKTENYIISTTVSEPVEKTIDANKLIQLLPYGSTDNVLFALDANSAENISFVYDKYKIGTVEKDYISKIIVNPNSSGTIVVYPISEFDEEYKEYASNKITIHFVKALTEDVLNNIVSAGRDLKQVVLLANDSTIVELESGDTMSLNSLKLDLSNIDYANYYNLNTTTSVPNILEPTVINENSIIVEAKSYSENIENIALKFEPKYVGEIESITKNISIAVDMRADYIKATNRRKDIVYNSEHENNFKVDIFDYYSGNSALGTLFNFTPSTLSNLVVRKDLSNMEILLDPQILKISNNVYTDNSFSTINDKLVNFGINEFLLEIRKGSGYLKFYYDSARDLLISETITNANDIYIKYEKNSNTTSSTDLKILVQTKNASEINYLNNAKLVSLTINFNRKEGIKSLKFVAGEYSTENGQIEITPIQAGVDSKEIYLNRKINTNAVLDFDNNAIIGRYNTVENAIFNVNIIYSGQETDNLLYVGAMENEGVIQPLKNNVFEYINNATNKQTTLYFGVNENTRVGVYTMTLEQVGTDFVSNELKVYVYETIQENEISDSVLNFNTNDKFFSNGVIDNRIYADYQADYIAEAGLQLSNALAVNLPSSVLNSNILNEITCSTDDDESISVVIDKNQVGVFGLNFIKGTYDFTQNMPSYVTITITIKLKKFSDIITVGQETNSLSISKSVYIYQPVTKNDAKLDKPYLSKYMFDLLGVYNQQTDGKEVLNVELDKNLWKYVPNEKVEWNISTTGNVEAIKSDKSISLIFNKSQNSSQYTVSITATINQFNNVVVLESTANVKKPVITENLILNSEHYYENNLPYINLRQEVEYTLDVTNVTSLNAEITHGGIVFYVVDKETGYVNNSNFTIVDNKLTFNNLDGIENANKFQLLIYAKDALDSFATSGNNYANPSQYLIDTSTWSYLNAFMIIDITLSTGDLLAPYEIHTAEEFYNLNLQAYKDKHFVIKNHINLNLSNFNEKTIENFTGYINCGYKLLIEKPLDWETNYKNYYTMLSNKYVKNTNSSWAENLFYEFIENNITTYSLSGIKLINNRTNLFKNFSGCIANINFEIEYNYDLSTGGNLGLFDVNNGKLINVCAYINEISTLSLNSASYNFGGLVGENNGVIEYTNQNIIGVTGKIQISGNGAVNFGGLVGKNLNTIKGYDLNYSTIDSNSSVEFSTQIGELGYISNLNIFGDILNQDAFVGGLVGLNTYNEFTTGTISNVVVSGNINLENTSNVGGVIGKNNSKGYIYSTDSELRDYSAEINCVRSNVGIIANNKVGGITAVDFYGVYSKIEYQIPVGATKHIDAKEYVGGIIGYGEHTNIVFASVYSYKWNYVDVSEFSTADIVGENYVGGIIGFAYNNGAQPSAENRTVIIHSSVNAYIQSNNVIGGIFNGEKITNTLYKTVVHNSYFYGKLIGNVSYFINNLCLDNNGSLSPDKVYSINSVSSAWELGYYSEDSSWTEETLKTKMDYWNSQSGINNGYIFVTSDQQGLTPIFELAPTNISFDKEYLKLEYFNFNLEDSDVLESLNNLYNFYEFNKTGISNILKITCEPNGIANVRLNISSNNDNVVKITTKGIAITGTGQATLTFSSALNNKVSKEIVVYVTTPLGDSFTLSESGEDANGGNKSTEKDKYEYEIAKGSSKLYYLHTSGKKLLNGKSYSYETLSNVGYNIKITGGDNDCISVSGNKIGDLRNLSLSENTPLSISVNAISSSVYTFAITPYITIAGQQVAFSKSFNFTLTTKVGATSVSMKYSEAVLYPNDITIVTAYITTDTEYENFDDLISLSLASETDLNLENIAKFTPKTINYENDLQIIEISLNIQESVKSSNNSFKLTLKLEVSNKQAKVDFTILPQRINKLELKNYINIGETGFNWQLSNALKPASKTALNGGLILINLVPNNAYYDYIEIKDVTGGEEIIFTQVKSMEGEQVIETKSTQDGLGIILEKPATASEIYVFTQISGKYSSRTHTIQVSAFVKGNFNPIQTNTMEIDVKMLPSIIAEYRKPDQTVGEIFESGVKENTLYFANGTALDFYITTRNANTELEHSLTGDASTNYKFEKVSENLYSLTCTNYQTTDSGKTLNLQLQVNAVLDNGSYETATLNLTIQIVDFIIHGISVTNSMGTGSNAKIYGSLNEDVNLELYFKSTDVSFYHNGSFWDKNYRYDKSLDGKTGSLAKINDILKELNNEDFAKYIFLNTGKDNNGNYIRYVYTNKIALENSSSKTGLNINVKDGYIIKDGDITIIPYLTVDFNLELNDNNKWDIKERTSTDGTISNICQTYNLDFNKAMALEEYLLVKSEEDFLNMSSGELNYILCRDLEFTNYTPIDVDLKEFNGNGHTITIKSFGTFSDQDIIASLFNEIPEGMLIKNLNVNYSSIKNSDSSYSLGSIKDKYYYDLCNNSTIDYSSATFAGLSAINNGLISNCNVYGEVALSASVVEKKIDTTSLKVELYLSGLVKANNGTITNSTSYLSLSAQANIAGFVYENNGKITSSSKETTETMGEIYAYNSNLTTKVEARVSAFVVDNLGYISMSFVLFNNSKTMSVKDISAGFVYNNSGSIKNCYVEMEKSGENQNTFSGFVQENNNSITNCYTYIDEGVKTKTHHNMFAPSGTTGIINSVEIINKAKTGSYNSGIENLNIVEINYKGDRELYENYGFAFGDNSSAVWKISSYSNPTLVSNEVRVKYTGSSSYNESYYPGLSNIKITKEIQDGIEKYSHEIDTANYGRKENPIIIRDMESWDYYFADNTTKYFRIIADIDFANLGDNPTTSTRVFSGNLQGNDMNLTNIMLYSSSSLSSIGLFKAFESVNDVSIQNTVANLYLTTSSVWATKTKAVGLLAGISTNFNIYNITVDSAGVVVVGGNAVGGIVGVSQGDFNIQAVSSNVGANSTRASSEYRYSIYMSKNNKFSESNLSNVYYAGAIAGILDGYNNYNFKIAERRDINLGYVKVRDVSVNGAIVVLGDSVGSAFGFVGEQVKIENVKVNLATGTKISGTQYSAGVVGENRGAIINVQVDIEAENVFDVSKYASAGVVGLNLYGLVQNVRISNLTIIKNDYVSTVGGVIARNIYGVVNNVSINAILRGYIVGTIIGGDYKINDFISQESGIGVLSAECRTNKYLLPELNSDWESMRYFSSGDEIKKLDNITISKETIDNYILDLKRYYSFNTTDVIKNYKAVGMLIGVSEFSNFSYTKEGKTYSIFNFTNAKDWNFSLSEKTEQDTGNEIKTKYLSFENDKLEFNENISINSEIKYLQIQTITNNDGSNVLFVVGGHASGFNSWSNASVSGMLAIVIN